MCRIVVSGEEQVERELRRWSVDPERLSHPLAFGSPLLDLSVASGEGMEVAWPNVWRSYPSANSAEAS